MRNISHLDALTELPRPIEVWCRLFSFHLERGTGRSGIKWSSTRRIEWTADDFINALSEHLGRNIMLSSATLESWKSGRTLPRGQHRHAMFKVFWPQPMASLRDEVEEFRTALASAATEHKARQTTHTILPSVQSIPLVPRPKALTSTEKIGTFLRHCEQLNDSDHRSILSSIGLYIDDKRPDATDVLARLSDPSFISKLSGLVDEIEVGTTARHKHQIQSITLPFKLLLSVATEPPPVGTISRDQEYSPDLVRIASGIFDMGSTFDDPEAYSNEFPSRKVEVFEKLLFGRFPVTFAEYDLYAQANGLELPFDEGWGRGFRPVIHVSWEQARAYALWLRELTGLEYRLCSEAEWEFAARAGCTSKYFWGTDWEPERLNYGEKMPGTTPVGSFPPKRLGAVRYVGERLGVGRR